MAGKNSRGGTAGREKKMKTMKGQPLVVALSFERNVFWFQLIRVKVFAVDIPPMILSGGSKLTARYS
jgi:hypothetical protein